MQQLGERAPRATLIDLPQAPKDAQLVVREAHIDLIALDIILRNGFQLCGRHRRQKLVQDRELKLRLCPGNQSFEVRLADAPDGVEVGGGAVVFGEVPAVCFVDVGGAEDEEPALFGGGAYPGEELGEEVGEDHAHAGLDVLEGEVFGF